MKTVFRFLTMLFLLLSATSCGSDDSYIVEGNIDGLGTRNLRLYYYYDGGMRSGIISALDGKFTFTGSAKKTTLLAIATNQRGIITTIAVKNGDYVKLSYTINEPWTFSADGNDINSNLTSFAADNKEIFESGDNKKLNAAVAEYVKANPGSETSAVLLAVYYDEKLNPQEYNSLLESLTPEVAESQVTEAYVRAIAMQNEQQMQQRVTPFTLYCADDSLFTFNPGKNEKGTLITLTDESRCWNDSLTDAIKELPSGIAVLNINLQSDTVLWHKTLGEISEHRGTDAWIPGSVSSPRLGTIAPVNSLPTFVAIDATGKRLYQGTSVNSAVNSFKK